MGTIQGCCVLFWTNPGSSTSQSSSCMAHLRNYSSKLNKTCRTLLKKQEQTYKWQSPMVSCNMDILELVDQKRHTSALWGHWMLLGGPVRRDRGWESVREFHVVSVMKYQTRHVRLCQRSKDELISNILLWTCLYGHTNVE